ncbi:hypothetical protein ACPYO6_04670 [Georgenia sp. Z1344]|uniref:hypothetical protein n=1 Tax=Georgenia sp. Z1344 TaxID=3416706 RepID=UPI003CF3C968
MSSPSPRSVPPSRRGTSLRAALTAVLAAVLAAVSLGPPAGVAVVTLVCSILLAVGLPRLLDLPHGSGAAWFLSGGALVIPGVVWFGGLDRVVLLVAGAVATAFVHQMVRRDGRPRLTESVAGDVLGLALMSFGTGWFVVAREPGGEQWVTAGALAVVVGTACAALPVTSWLAASLAVTAGGLVTAGFGALVPDVGWWRGALLGLVVGVLTAALHRTSARSPSSSRLRPALAAATIPLLAVGAVVTVILLGTT